MKNRFFKATSGWVILLLVFFTHTATAQVRTNVRFNRAVIDDSIWIHNTWINRINNTGTLTNSNHSLPTDSTVRAAIIAGGGGGGGAFWSLTGNNGTETDVNWIGTNDDNDFQIATHGIVAATFESFHALHGTKFTLHNSNASNVVLDAGNTSDIGLIGLGLYGSYSTIDANGLLNARANSGWTVKGNGTNETDLRVIRCGSCGDGTVFSTEVDGFEKSFVIKSSGNVGIGTTAPAYQLDVANAINAANYYISGVPMGLGAIMNVDNNATNTLNMNGNDLNNVGLLLMTGQIYTQDNINVGSAVAGGSVIINSTGVSGQTGQLSTNNVTGVRQYELPDYDAQLIGQDVNGSVGIGTTAAPSAVLHVESTTKGVLFPRMTASQRDAIVSPAEGLIIYNTDSHALNIYNGSTWQKIQAT